MRLDFSRIQGGFARWEAFALFMAVAVFMSHNLGFVRQYGATPVLCVCFALAYGGLLFAMMMSGHFTKSESPQIGGA